ncbi:MAG: hypothetical protein HRT47_08785 [Candidatus Caenarcaniphilales bacterium]|nr:hypothetical protein [Candidatus Caenarcaniphilales bacterium]
MKLIDIFKEVCNYHQNNSIEDEHKILEPKNFAISTRIANNIKGDWGPIKYEIGERNNFTCSAKIIFKDSHECEVIQNLSKNRIDYSISIDKNRLHLKYGNRQYEDKEVPLRGLKYLNPLKDLNISGALITAENILPHILQLEQALKPMTTDTQ